MAGSTELLFPGMSGEQIDARLKRLRTQNLILGVLHLVQAIAVWMLNETKFTLPIGATISTDAPGVNPPVLQLLYRLDVGLWVFLFLAISAIAHFTIASPWYFPKYVADIKRGKNTARWVEYSLSSSIMVILIASITGVVDIAAMLGIFGANAAMIAFGDLQERYEQPGGRMIPFWLGTFFGLVPWVAIGCYIFGIGSDNYDISQVPSFVWLIFVLLFVFFFSFGLNQWLQYKRVGKWKNYFRGETAYVVLSLVAKSLLAWQIFANVLVMPNAGA